ncbi:hypothetical protein BH11PSE7_BH11PSE7_17440 [soil metagenome]
MKKLAVALAATAAFAAPLLSHAESAINTTNLANATAAANLDFRVTVPRVLYLRVGTGTANAVNATKDLIDFTVPAANVGTGVAVAATAASGDLTNGAVTVRLFGNGGNISLNSSTTGLLNNGVAAQTLPWSQIGVVVAPLAATTAGYTNGTLAHPTLNNTAGGGLGTATALTAVNKLVLQEAKWTYSYLNAAFVASGTYGGAGVNNGRVTYTATMP